MKNYSILPRVLMISLAAALLSGCSYKPCYCNRNLNEPQSYYSDPYPAYYHSRPSKTVRVHTGGTGQTFEKDKNLGKPDNDKRPNPGGPHGGKRPGEKDHAGKRPQDKKPNDKNPGGSGAGKPEVKPGKPGGGQAVDKGRPGRSSGGNKSDSGVNRAEKRPAQRPDTGRPANSNRNSERKPAQTQTVKKTPDSPRKGTDSGSSGKSSSPSNKLGRVI